MSIPITKLVSTVVFQKLFKAPGLVDPTSYGGYGTTGYDQSGVGYVGDDWQNYDWSKLAQSEPAKEVAVPQATQANMLASIPGMEGLTQKQINK